MSNLSNTPLNKSADGESGDIAGGFVISGLY